MTQIIINENQPKQNGFQVGIDRYKKIEKRIVLLCSLFAFTITFSNAQEQSKELTGIISLEYKTYNEPITVEYKVFPYGGSGNYLYRWKTKTGKFGEYVDSDVFTMNISCSSLKRPEITMICQIKDVVSGKTYLTILKHPVEFCLK